MRWRKVFAAMAVALVMVTGGLAINKATPVHAACCGGGYYTSVQLEMGDSYWLGGIACVSGVNQYGNGSSACWQLAAGSWIFANGWWWAAGTNVHIDYWDSYGNYWGYWNFNVAQPNDCPYWWAVDDSGWSGDPCRWLA